MLLLGFVFSCVLFPCLTLRTSLKRSQKPRVEVGTQEAEAEAGGSQVHSQSELCNVILPQKSIAFNPSSGRAEAVDL